MSNGGVLKSGWVVVKPGEAKIIDSNARAEARLKEMALELARQCGEEPDFAENFTQGINAVDVASLIRDGEGSVIGGEQDIDEEILGAAMEESAPPPRSQTQEELIAEAQAEIEEMQKEAQLEIEQERLEAVEEGRNQGYQEGLEQGRQEGFAQGHQDGLDSVAGEKEQALAEVNEKAASMEAEYERRIRELEPRFIDLLTGIYEHIFHVNLKNFKEIIVYLIQNTMHNIEGGGSYLIHVSKEDYPFANMQKKELIRGTNIDIDNVELLEDATLGRNECMIETDNGVFDCGLGTQLEGLNEELRMLSYRP